MNPAVADLNDVIDRALDRGAHLLTAGERRVVARMRGLDGDPALAWARLTSRVAGVYEVARLTLAGVDDVPAALHALAEAGLVDGLVGWEARARALLKDDLIAALRALGLPARGRRDALLERLQDHTGFTDARFVRVRHRALIRRLERWAFLVPWPDRSTLVMDRIGVVRWPSYAITSGAALPSTRRAWLAYERVADGLGGAGEPLTAEGALQALRDGVARAPGRLDLTRSLRGALLEEGHRLEREGLPRDAVALYERLVAEGGAPRAAVAFRHAQALAADDRRAEALDVLAAARAQAGPVPRLAIVRAMRRIARSLRRGVAPDPPLRTARRREIRLDRHEPDAEPRARWGDEARLIEDAVCRWLADHGREARHGEGRPFSTLFALLFADVLFLPVPGALPVRFLSRPLDFGRPGFREARRDAIDAVLADIDRGEAADRVRETWDRLQGVRITGARWAHATPDELAVLAEHLGPAGLRAILEPILDGGAGRWSGLPDLVVWPGPAVRLPGALPSRLSGELHLAEIKGPGDRLSDPQRLWLDRLVRAGVRTELWEVVPPP